MNRTTAPRSTLGGGFGDDCSREVPVTETYFEMIGARLCRLYNDAEMLRCVLQTKADELFGGEKADGRTPDEPYSNPSGRISALHSQIDALESTLNLVAQQAARLQSL